MVSNMKGKVKAIFFDLDDTLVLTKDIDVQAYQEVVSLARQILPGVEEDNLLADWRTLFASQPWDPEHQVEVESWRARLWQQAVVQQGVPCSKEAAEKLQNCFSSTRLQLFQFLPGVEDMIQLLTQQGYRLVVITNGHHLVQRQKVESCRAGRLFQHILVGGEEILEGRHEKPHPLIFQRACQLANCRPEEAVHVGDSLSCDVQGGINAGLAATIWVNASGKQLPEGSPCPDFVVQSVLEVPGVLQEIVGVGTGGRADDCINRRGGPEEAAGQ